MPTSYDEVAYPSFSFAQSHPDRLATIATLFGMSPAPVERCRVLELGCGNGSNLIPMAFSLPGSRFCGVDLAASQIEAGVALAGRLELQNIDLRPLDLTRITREFGEFDYIIAHGVYSWVPPHVREKMFEIARENLAPNGVAYISYNAYPGGHLRRMVREILLYHIRDIRDPAERIRESLALARHISNWRHAKDNERDLLRDEFARLLRYDPHHFYHDDIADCNEPVYFHDFVDQAARHRLQYLGEADFYEMQPPPPVPDEPDPPRLPARDDRVAYEQYLDFLRCRRFRQTLLCHADVKLEGAASSSRLRSLFLASPLRPESGRPDFGPGKIERFIGPKGSQIETDFPVAKAALGALGEVYPSSLTFEEVLKRSRRLAAGPGDGDDWPDQIAAELAGMLLMCYGVNAVEVSAGPPRFTVEVSERPTASRLVREQLKTGQVVVNQRHRLVEIPDEKARLLLQLADGARDLEKLRTDLAAALQAEIIADKLRSNLQNAANCALLVS